MCIGQASAKSDRLTVAAQAGRGGEEGRGGQEPEPKTGAAQEPSRSELGQRFDGDAPAGPEGERLSRPRRPGDTRGRTRPERCGTRSSPRRRARAGEVRPKERSRAAPSPRPGAARRRSAHARARARPGRRACTRDDSSSGSCLQVVGGRPFISRMAVLSSSMTSWVATVIAKVSRGRTASGMLALESTVVRSETGSDFQNRMLRSRRSPCSASRQ